MLFKNIFITVWGYFKNSYLTVNGIIICSEEFSFVRSNANFVSLRACFLNYTGITNKTFVSLVEKILDVPIVWTLIKFHGLNVCYKFN